MSIFESVNPTTVPHGLALRLVTGEASRVLALFIETGTLSERGSRALHEAARLLREGTAGLDETGNSFAESADRMELIVAATEALRPTALPELVDELTATAADLDKLAEHGSLPVERVEVLDEQLMQIRDVLAAHRTVMSDEPISTIL